MTNGSYIDSDGGFRGRDCCDYLRVGNVEVMHRDDDSGSLGQRFFGIVFLSLFFFFSSDCLVRYCTPYLRSPSAGQATGDVSGGRSCSYPSRSLAVRILIELRSISPGRS